MKIFDVIGNEPSGMWYCVVDNQGQEMPINRVAMLWEAWAWHGQSDPPQVFQQEGYRWRRIGEERQG